MSLPANPIIEPFALNASAGFKNVIPLTTGTNGAASFDQGFPQVTALAVSAGGVPPNIADFNGILNMTSAYCAMLQSGQLCQYSSAVATAIGGYSVGAVLAKASGVGLWTNLIVNNMSDPDTGGSGWIDGVPAGAGYLSYTAASGTTNNVAPSGFDAEVAFLDVDISAGNATFTGLAGGTDGQAVTITPINSSSNTLALTSLDGGSSAANRFRLSGSITLTQYVPQSFKYSSTLNLWIPTS